MIALYSNLDEARRALVGSRVLDAVDLPAPIRETIREVFGEALSPAQVVERIIADVRADGDEAVRRYTWLLDGVDVEDLVVPHEEVQAALREVPATLRKALEIAADRVRAFYERSRRSPWMDVSADGALGQVLVPLERVGIYAPGGRAAYPSTVLMGAVPARVAGVREIVLASPPRKDGRQNAAVLAAAQIAGVDRVYRVGGAQAIAALAYGTASITRVDKIVGPGNLFVVLAKKALAGVVGIDGLPGPTETVVIADGRANPAWLAADMIAQAEHDPLAQSVLLCTDQSVAEAVFAELERQVAEAPRRDVVLESFRRRGAIVVAESVEAAIDFANEHAPEHLCLSVADPWSYLPQVRHAGGVFLGEMSVEALGDYTAGPSHIMPTGGAARYASALSLDDFTRVMPVFAYDPARLRRAAEAAIALAQAEGLAGHAAAIEARLKGAGGSS